MFVNQTFVYEHAFSAYYGNRFGFHVPPSETMNVDYVYLKYINLNFGKGEELPAPPPSVIHNMEEYNQVKMGKPDTAL